MCRPPQAIPGPHRTTRQARRSKRAVAGRPGASSNALEPWQSRRRPVQSVTDSVGDLGPRLARQACVEAARQTSSEEQFQKRAARMMATSQADQRQSSFRARSKSTAAECGSASPARNRCRLGRFRRPAIGPPASSAHGAPPRPIAIHCPLHSAAVLAPCHRKKFVNVAFGRASSAQGRRRSSRSAVRSRHKELAGNADNQATMLSMTALPGPTEAGTHKVYLQPVAT